MQTPLTLFKFVAKAALVIEKLPGRVASYLKHKFIHCAAAPEPSPS